MTETQKKRITKLRQQGFGYRRHGFASGDVIMEKPHKEPTPHRETITRTPKVENAEPVCDVTLSFADESEFSLRDLACILKRSPIGR